MKQFNNVLLVGPFKRHLLTVASGLMTASQSKLTLLSVTPELEVPRIVTEDGKKVDLQALLQKDVKEDLIKTAASLAEKDLRVKTVVREGHYPFIEIITQVQSKKHDLVMMLADGVGSLRDQLFGTLSMHLLRKCPCAVWIVKPTRRKKLRNVFAAVDPDTNDPTRDQLNVEILQRAMTVAQNNNAKLHVMHAWNALGGNSTRGRRWMSRQEIRLYQEKVAATHRDALNRFLEKYSDGSAVVHMLQGKPGEVIPKHVAHWNADLLVMGTVCRTGIPGFFIGNTAETILNQVDCSVLTVKPKEFVSPVTPTETSR
ncbi:MAG: universal stress protein [Planctomycetota bacterium]